MATRKVYCCPTCQPLVSAEGAAMAVATHAPPKTKTKDFCSCLAVGPLEKKTVKELQVELATLGLPKSGKKNELVARLKAHLAAQEAKPEPGAEVKPGEGTEMAPFTVAAAEKARAGENRAVEHVGLVDATGGAPAKAEGKKKKKADEPLGFRQRKRRSA